MKYLFAILCLLIQTFISAQSQLLQSGPMVGYSEMKEVLIWVQTKEKAQVKIAYWDKSNPQTKKYTDEISTIKEKAYTAHLIADQVEPGKHYEYELFINNKSVRRPYPLEFQTQILWQWRTDPPTFKFAAGSCTYVNDPPYDRPEEPYGGDYSIFTSIHQQKPDFMLWLGDNTYLREADWGSRTGMIYRYTHTRSLPEMQPLLGSIHNYAIWDDHDFGSNDSDGSFPNKNISLELFKLFWGNPNYGVANTDGKGITGSFVWGDVQFFLLDDRYFRTSNRNPTGTRAMFGSEQTDWLINALSYSKASFKIIAVGGQVLNPSLSKENLANFSEEYKKLIETIQKAKIEGVLFMSGDRHFTELTKFSPEGFYPLYDLTVSPLTSGVGNPKYDNNFLREPNTLITEKNFAIIEVSGKFKERVLKIQIYNKDNQLKWTKEIKQSDLTIK